MSIGSKNCMRSLRPLKVPPMKGLLSMEKECAHAVKNVKTYCRVGMSAREIVALAQEESVDLIVMGTHGRTGVKHLVMGSVARSVLKTAHSGAHCRGTCRKRGIVRELQVISVTKKWMASSRDAFRPLNVVLPASLDPQGLQVFWGTLVRLRLSGGNLYLNPCPRLSKWCHKRAMVGISHSPDLCRVKPKKRLNISTACSKS